MWGIGAVAVGLFVAGLASGSGSGAAPGTTGVPAWEAAAADTVAQRARDSLAVLALTRDSLPPDSALVRLEFVAHRRRFGIPHQRAHNKYVEVMLDSVARRLTSGRDDQLAPARHDLSFIDGPLTPKQDHRREALFRRVVTAEAAAEKRLATKQAVEERRRAAQLAAERMESVRRLKQGDCTPPVARVRVRLREHPEWSDDMIAMTACRRVQIGMTREQAISSWGRPNDINRTTYSFGVHEQWVYGEYGSGYLYFEDGVLKTVQN